MTLTVGAVFVSFFLFFSFDETSVFVCTLSSNFSSIIYQMKMMVVAEESDTATEYAIRGIEKQIMDYVCTAFE